jgi:hypothetical protein
MQRRRIWVLASSLLVACSSSSSSNPTKPQDAGAKLPSLDAGKPAGQGKKGGTNTQPSASSQSASGPTTSSQQRTKVDADGDNPCADVPDGKAVCGSDTALLFCAGQQLYQIDCNALMTSSEGGFASGACYQTDTKTDCFGCGAAADGSNLCCAPASSGPWLCCDDSTTCALVTP